MSELDRIPDWMTTPDTTSGRQLNLQTWAQEFRDVYNIAEALCKTPFVPREMLGKQADVAAAIMKGRELGLDPFDALGSIYIVHGRVGFYAEFMRRRIIQAGHTLRILENTDSRCVIEGTRKDSNEPQRATFTADQARRAGIDLGKYAADKLVARATSRLCRQVFPEVLSGSLIAEDLIDGLIPTDAADTDTAAIPPPAASVPAQRTRKPRAAKAASTQPKPAPTPAEPDTELTELLGDDNPPPQTAPAETENQSATTPQQPRPAPTQECGNQYNDNIHCNQPPGHEGDHHGTTTSATYTWDDTGHINTDIVHASYTPEPDLPATSAQNRKMHALFRQLDLGDRDDRLTVTTHILGYHLNTSAGLTKNEANKIIDTLETWRGDTDYPVEDRVNDILNQAALAAEAEEEEKNYGN